MADGNFSDAEAHSICKEKREAEERTLKGESRKHDTAEDFQWGVEIMEAMTGRNGNDRISKLRNHDFIPRVLPVPSPAGDHIISLLNKREKFFYFCRVVLQIRVTGDDDVAAAFLNAGPECFPFAGVNWQAVRAESRKPPLQCFELVERTIGRSIVNGDHVIGLLRHSMGNFAKQRLQAAAFIEDRNYKGILHD